MGTHEGGGYVCWDVTSRTVPRGDLLDFMTIRALGRPVRLLRLLVLLALLLAALPPAAADHVYSHRYLTLIHVAGAGGGPVANATVNATYGFATEGACAARASAFGTQLAARSGKTDPTGTLALCTHAHAVASGATVTIEVAGFNATGRVDHETRLTIVEVTTDRAAGANASLLHARLWRRGATDLEGVPVEGLALAATPVNLTFFYANGSERKQFATTDSYGDIAGRLPAGVVRVAGEGAWGNFSSSVPTSGILSLVAPTPPRAASHLSLSAIPKPEERDEGGGSIPMPLLLAAASLALAGRRRAR